MAYLSKQQVGSRWRRYQSKYRLAQGPVPVIALMNLALLLVLFLVVGSKIVLQPGMVINLPVAAFVSGAFYGNMVVTVTQEGQVFFNDDRTPLDRLGPALIDAVRKNREISMTIEADARVSYETIVRIMNLAAAAGVRQVNLATRLSFGEEVMP